MPYTASELAERLQGKVVGDGSIVLHGFAPADLARPGDLTFAENEAYFALAQASQASAILVANEFPSDKVLIRVPNARVAFARVLPLFFPEPVFAPGIHPTAVIAPTVQIHPTACIGPYCVVGDHATIGARAVLEAGDHVGEHSTLAEDVRLFPRVTLYPRTQVGRRVRIHAGSVIGADGFGYVFDGGAHQKVPQVGSVIIHDDVEVGANVTIDRGALGATIIGRGTKIDNMVHVAHNVVIGEHCLLCAQTGIAGSSRLGNYVTCAGQVGVGDHVTIGDRVTLAAQSGLMNHVPEGEKWMGSPARPSQRMKRQYIALEHLPALLKRVAALERQLAEAQSRAPQPRPPSDSD